MLNNYKLIIQRASFKEAQRIKHNQGISLIALIITIIVMIIIAGIVINSYQNSSEKASSSKVLNEFIEVENAVSILGKMHKMDANVHKYVGKALAADTAMTVNNKTYGEGYYYLEGKDLYNIGVNGATRNYIVNYLTGEVVATECFIVNSRDIYTKADIIDEETGNSVAGLPEYDEENGVNKPVLYHGMIPVKLEGSYWVVCSVNDREWYDYTIGSSGPNRWANAMLLDDITLRDSSGKIYSNEVIRGAKLEELVGLYVVSEGSMFVWLPRYTFKEGTSQIVYSRLTQDYTLNGYIKSPAFYNGEYKGAQNGNDNGGYVAGGKELTGIWISKYQASYAN